MSRDNPLSLRWDFGSRAAVCLGVLLLGAAVGCGVREYPHDVAPVDTNNDFGPSAGTGTNTLPTPSNPIVPTSPAGVGGSMLAVPMAGVGGVLIGPTPGGRPALPTAGVSGAVMMPTAGVMAPNVMPTMPTGVTLDLGGTAVTKENVIAFIHIGHSNMAGRATGPTASRPYFFSQPDPHAWMYHAGNPPQPAKEPDTAGDDLSGTYGGPGTALIKQAVAMAPSKYFLSLGYGKASAYCSQFLPGALYYDALMKAPLAIKDRVTFGAIVIMLGITERHGTAADVTGYAQCINKLVTAIRKDLGRPDLPLLITDYEQMATGALAVNQAFPQSIIPEIRKIPMVVSNSMLVPTDGLGMEDDHHFNFDGHKVWTGRVLQIMKDKGWFPWTK
jgi:hypothetical protein